MATKFIVPPTRPTPQTADAIRARVRHLTRLYGSVLNDWPLYAISEHAALTRQLRALEATPVVGVRS